jgi:hypothetical protein
VLDARLRELNVWTPSELQTFLELVVDDRLGAVYRLIATTVMRRGEVAGFVGRTST